VAEGHEGGEDFFDPWSLGVLELPGHVGGRHDAARGCERGANGPRLLGEVLGPGLLGRLRRLCRPLRAPK
jgi:hypothetical protein